MILIFEFLAYASGNHKTDVENNDCLILFSRMFQTQENLVCKGLKCLDRDPRSGFAICMTESINLKNSLLFVVKFSATSSVWFLVAGEEMHL